MKELGNEQQENKYPSHSKDAVESNIESRASNDDEVDIEYLPIIDDMGPLSNNFNDEGFLSEINKINYLFPADEQKYRRFS